MTQELKLLVRLEQEEEMEELKPCPFCGAVPELAPWGNKFFIECRNGDCPVKEIMTDDYSTEKAAIEAWNQRA